ncbi:hypothetical protein [Demequina muriae]|uniref:SseB protein N-terminal domain-containing protein n=1 Tax=Demequina muriae TaxID=3051664 RepID=A0ABT8GFR6_9MICO|nr:hypothetical protein [Demequina sp. EGI L300058]MDN4480283.1 hypothetical protein [Demequina sp. EGI L300058]
MTTPSPQEVLNTLMDARASEEGTRVAMGRLFLEITVAVPSTGDPAKPGGFTPLMVERDTHDCVVTLTSKLALQRSQSVVPYALEMTGAALISSLQPHLGVLVENGTSSFVLTPAFVAYLRNEGSPSIPGQG